MNGRKHPRNSRLAGEGYRLDGYRRQPINTVEVLGLNRNKIALLVVPPNTDPDEAHATLMAAAAPSNDSTVDSLLTISARDREIRTQAAGAQERWKSARGAALESSVVAHALVELESQLIGLRTQLAVAESIFDPVRSRPT